MASGNQYTLANFTGALQNPGAEATVDLSYNQLTSLNITGCVQLTNLNASSNQLNSAAVDSILHTLDTLGRTGGTVDLRYNLLPTADGLAHITSLEGKGWTVYMDE